MVEHGTNSMYNLRPKGCRCGPCRAAHNEYQRGWAKRNPDSWTDWASRNKDHLKDVNLRRSKWFTANLSILKAAQGCALCGKMEGRLVHHHCDKDSKKVGVANMFGYSVEDFIDEIAKCVVLCASCHSRFHAHDYRMPYGPQG